MTVCTCASRTAGTFAAAISLLVSPVFSAVAQESSAAGEESVQEVVVTATKRAGGVSVHEAPLSVSAFGANTLQQLHVERISDLTNNVPNVNLSSTTSFPGFSNYTIRGMSVYSTIPSSTPTVGVFVDGIYLGTPAGVGFNTFDLEGVEVLRGPQGLFFGRNVTAGAILVRTTAPKGHFGGNAQVSVESGLDYTGSAMVTGPLTGKLDGKLALYWNKDEGYFDNIATGGKNGKSRTWVGHGALSYQATDFWANVLRYEHGDLNGDGAVNQDHVRLGRGEHDFRTRQGTPGFILSNWDQLTLQSDIDTGRANDTITNILGWRQIDQAALIDNDATPILGWDQYSSIKHHQISDELRYSGKVNIVDVTGGVFYYKDALGYVEDRLLYNGATHLVGGGALDTWTFAEFANFDLHIPYALTISVGERWSAEGKNADVEPLVSATTSPCSISIRTCTGYKFPGNKGTWYAFTPRMAIGWQPDPSTNLYAFWTKGFRSGGFNLRDANPNQVPIPYGQEVENTYEAGIKKNAWGNRLIANLSVFQNNYKDLQRDIQIFGTPVGTVQTTSNAADVIIRGFELESSVRVIDELAFNGNIGYLHSRFTRIKVDLSGNGTIGPEDYALKLPFLSPWSFGVGMTYDRQTALGLVAARVSYNYKDRSASNDSNNRFLPVIRNLDADLSLTLVNHVTLSVYGKNLLNFASYGFDNEFTLSNPALGPNNPLRAIASPINKGRIVGGRVNYEF
jgi:iron complex outermembrane recepter protein